MIQSICQVLERRDTHFGINFDLSKIKKPNYYKFLKKSTEKVFKKIK